MERDASLCKCGEDERTARAPSPSSPLPGPLPSGRGARTGREGGYASEVRRSKGERAQGGRRGGRSVRPHHEGWGVGGRRDRHLRRAARRDGGRVRRYGDAERWRVERVDAGRVHGHSRFGKDDAGRDGEEGKWEDRYLLGAVHPLRRPEPHRNLPQNDAGGGSGVRSERRRLAEPRLSRPPRRVLRRNRCRDAGRKGVQPRIG